MVGGSAQAPLRCPAQSKQAQVPTQFVKPQHQKEPLSLPTHGPPERPCALFSVAQWVWVNRSWVIVTLSL